MPPTLAGAAAQGFVLAALAVPWLAVPHAMCAAFVTGGLFAVSEVLHLHASLDGRVSFSDAAAIVLPFVLFGGALVALACAASVRLLSAPVRRLLVRARRRRPDRGRTGPPKGAQLEPFL